jgi:hypothetical protein
MLADGNPHTLDVKLHRKVPGETRPVSKVLHRLDDRPSEWRFAKIRIFGIMDADSTGGVKCERIRRFPG